MWGCGCGAELYLLLSIYFYLFLPYPIYTYILPFTYTIIYTTFPISTYVLYILYPKPYYTVYTIRTYLPGQFDVHKSCEILFMLLLLLFGGEVLLHFTVLWEMTSQILSSLTSIL